MIPLRLIAPPPRTTRTTRLAVPPARLRRLVGEQESGLGLVLGRSRPCRRMAAFLEVLLGHQHLVQTGGLLRVVRVRVTVCYFVEFHGQEGAGR